MTTKLGLDHHAYTGAPRRVGSSWSTIERNPPTAHAWADWKREHDWSYRGKNRIRKPKKMLTQSQQADALFAKLLAGKVGK